MSEKGEDTCLFCRIGQHQIPAEFIYEDDRAFVIKDKAPKAPVHLLIIPRRHISRIDALQPEDGEVLVHLFEVVHFLVTEYGLEDGFRIIINAGPGGGQTIPHLHLHLLAGRLPRFE